MSPSASAFSSAMHALVSNLLAKTDAAAAAADAAHPADARTPADRKPPPPPATPASLNQLASPTPTPAPVAARHANTQLRQQLQQQELHQHQQQQQQQQQHQHQQQQPHELLSPPAPAPASAPAQESVASVPNLLPPRLAAKRSRSGRTHPPLPQLITSGSPSATASLSFPGFQDPEKPPAKASRTENLQSVASNVSHIFVGSDFAEPNPLSTIRSDIISSMHDSQIESFNDPYTPLTRVFNELANIPLNNHVPPQIDSSIAHPVDPVIQYLVGNFAETMKEFRKAPVNSVDPNVFAFQPLPEARMLFDRELSLAFSSASGDSLDGSFLSAATGMPQNQHQFAQMEASLQSVTNFNKSISGQPRRPSQSLQASIRPQFSFHQQQNQSQLDSCEQQHTVAPDAARAGPAATIYSNSSSSSSSSSNSSSASPFLIKQLARGYGQLAPPPSLQPQQLRLLPPGLRGAPPTRAGGAQHSDGLVQQLPFNNRPAVPSPLAAQQGKPGGGASSTAVAGTAGIASSATPATGAAEAKFKCLECRKAFKLQDSLTSHMLVAHAMPTTSAAGPAAAAADDSSAVTAAAATAPAGSSVKLALSCEFCEQTFSRSHDLKRHLFSHKGERPFSCGRCGKGFSRRDILRKHEEAFARGKKINCFPAVVAAGAGSNDGILPVALAAAAAFIDSGEAV
ncbi:hypothetical protein HDU83_008896 [Entophlyctis luteolus]|nr:hypothetical protein HDU83_008896 [Entophlyctis luteolus]